MKPGALVFDNVSKVYRWRRKPRRHETLKGLLFGSGGKNLPDAKAEHVALEGVDLAVRPGEVPGNQHS